MGDVLIGIVIFIMFIIVDIVFWYLLIKTLIDKSISGNVLQNGENTKGYYVSHEPVIIINGVSLYKITFLCKNKYGMPLEYTTNKTYTLAESMVLKKIKEFDVKISENIGIIVTQPEECLKDFNLAEFLAEKHLERCAYCGSIISDEAIRCSQCGAKK